MLSLTQDGYQIALFEDGVTPEEIKVKLDASGKTYFTLDDIKIMLSGKSVVPHLSEEFARINYVKVD